MAWKKLKPGESKGVSHDGKNTGRKVRATGEKGKKAYEILDANGKVIGTSDNEDNATKRARNETKRDLEKKQGGSLKGDDKGDQGGSTPRARAARRAPQPGGILKKHLDDKKKKGK